LRKTNTEYLTDHHISTSEYKFSLNEMSTNWYVRPKQMCKNIEVFDRELQLCHPVAN